MAAKTNKLVMEITPRDQDFARWYTDIVRKAELCEYSSVKGCMILEPAGYAIWEAIMADLDSRFKAVGVQNVAMPIFIPESLLKRESEFVEGFAPEVAWVTEGGYDKLEERICVRPTSESLFSDYYAHKVQSYRDLPKVLNQWCSVVRWEKTTRPFLRSREFYWQEGHTCHATSEESRERTLMMLKVYEDFIREDLAIPVITGQKTDKEKFAGAEATFTIEALMHDGQALQSATSHDFGTNFAEAFDIQYTDRDNTLKYATQTSWGLSTRIIGAIIMVHGDDEGLKLPPRIAPTEVIICPIMQDKPGVSEAALKLEEELKAAGYRVATDLRDKTPGFKFADSEMRGIPLRIEIGPRDIEAHKIVLVRRDTHDKESVDAAGAADTVGKLLSVIQDNMYAEAERFLKSHIFSATNIGEMQEILDKRTGFVKAMWCGDRACEERIKDETGASTRCIPFEQEVISDTCICCGKPARKMVYFGRAY